MYKDRTEILAALDEGEISADEAVRLLEAPDSSIAVPTPEEIDLPKHWPYLWTVPVTLGAIGLFGGYGLASLGGWWWLLATPTLLLGGILFALGLASIESPWVHIRVQSDEQDRVSEFGLSLPLPLRPAIWLINNFGGLIPALGRTSVDDLIVALETTRESKRPIIIDVNEDETGEQVRVYLG